MEHLGQPVEGCIGVTTPQALDEGAGRVVVIVPGAVVDKGLFLDALRGRLQRDADPPLGSERRGAGGDLQGIEAFAGVAVADGGQMKDRRLVEVERE